MLTTNVQWKVFQRIFNGVTNSQPLKKKNVSQGHNQLVILLQPKGNFIHQFTTHNKLLNQEIFYNFLVTNFSNSNLFPMAVTW